MWTCVSQNCVWRRITFSEWNNFLAFSWELVSDEAIAAVLNLDNTPTKLRKWERVAPITKAVTQARGC